ncbi:MAG TPA: DUF4404 domain-containing protein [Spirochaetota bacterium]|nr:DUF4404 domain-containing protein [Spirochaetota bacterium]HNT10466.1 DUF4404 domain-containing protein [Spirochaetota bacterium]
MIPDTIEKIEKKINGSRTISDEKKRELLKLVNELKREVLAASGDDRDGAQSVANFANASAHEALREIVDPRMFELARNGLSESVRRFEVTNPGLVSVVNALSTVLANMGI